MSFERSASSPLSAVQTFLILETLSRNTTWLFQAVSNNQPVIYLPLQYLAIRVTTNRTRHISSLVEAQSFGINFIRMVVWEPVEFNLLVFQLFVISPRLWNKRISDRGIQPIIKFPAHVALETFKLSWEARLLAAACTQALDKPCIGNRPILGIN